MIEPLQHPRERVNTVREPTQPDGIAPLRILQRRDGPLFVYDPSKPLGRRTVATRETYEDAVTAAFALKGGAT